MKLVDPEDRHVIGRIVTTALIFGVAHLPTAVSITSGLSTVVVARVVVLEGIAGIAFGWLYWTRGILAAMTTHLATNTVIHVITPLVLTV